MKLDNISLAVRCLTKYYNIKELIEIIKECVSNKNPLKIINSKCKTIELPYKYLDSLIQAMENDLDEIEEQIKEL